MHSFFKYKNDFKSGFDFNLRPKQYTVVVVYLNGFKKEYACIEKPFQYINKIKKNPKVKNAFIKDN